MADWMADLQRSAGALQLDVALAGRVPAADGQVVGKVLVSCRPAVDRRHFGLKQMRRKQLRSSSGTSSVI